MNVKHMARMLNLRCERSVNDVLGFVPNISNNALARVFQPKAERRRTLKTFSLQLSSGFLLLRCCGDKNKLAFLWLPSIHTSYQLLLLSF